MLSKIPFKELIIKNFEHEPTNSQLKLIQKLADFMAVSTENDLFILKGYAGTGKTSAISSLIKSLQEINLATILLAPTGRAAKVLSNYSNKQALTIHKKLYRKFESLSGDVSFSLADNTHSNTVFIVDEASMIAHGNGLTNGTYAKTSILEDLMAYVFQGLNCKLILVGDSAQLPPVGEIISPALNEEYLKSSFCLTINAHELNEVVRQKSESGILENAKNIRILLYQDLNFIPRFKTKIFSDVHRIRGGELEDAIQNSYSKKGLQETIIICRSNKRANLFNQQIRNRILWRENEIEAGDLLMVVKNNYFWLPEKSQANFIANGDIIEIIRVKKIEELYGFRFANVSIRLIDYVNQDQLEVKILLNTIHSESPALSSENQQELYQQITQDYIHIADRTKRLKEIKENPYFNALQVKFAYAVTCHKAQGGQWLDVFVDQGYLTKEMLNSEYVRWLYTAVTRASENLYLVNFDDEYFDE